MTVEPWLAWLAFGTSIALYIAGAATAATFGPGPLAWARAGNGSSSAAIAGEGLPPNVARLNFGAIASASRTIAAISLISASFALAFALSTTSLSFSASLAIAGAALASGMLALAAIVTRLELPGRTRTRAAVLPVGRLLHRICSLPYVRAVITTTSGADQLDPKSEDDALDDGLSLLEAAGVSADPGELEMIRAVLRLDRARVREIMQPRVDMVAAESTITTADLVLLMTDHGHSRIPIYDDTIDKIVGVVHAQDLLRAGVQNNGNTGLAAKDLARQVLFVPEAQMLDQLLREFQRARTQIAIVIDEYGGVSGLVTVQDLIEEIVGELVDEFDTDEPEMQRISDVEIRVDARMPLDTLRQELGVEIESEGFDTVGGLVYRELGKMPSPGDQVAIEGIRLTVESTMGRRIRNIRVRRLLAPIDSTP
ncbi:MAG: HlyC/CorC family transporter [Chloroflexi bacterium]|nr:HlyC/CorC family transporter [Chloroflexota bacterium]